MDTTNNPFSSFETRLLIGAAAAAVAIVGGAVLYTQASASPATVAEAPAPVEAAPEAPTPAGPFMPDLVGMDVADAQAEVDALGIASTATDTCEVNGCHTAIVECNDGDGGWIDVRDTGAEKVQEQQFQPGEDLAGVAHVDLISYDYCPFGTYERQAVEPEPEREAPFMPAPMPTPTPEPNVEPAPTPTPEQPIIEEPFESEEDDDEDADVEDETEDSDVDDDDDGDSDDE